MINEVKFRGAKSPALKLRGLEPQPPWFLRHCIVCMRTTVVCVCVEMPILATARNQVLKFAMQVDLGIFIKIKLADLIVTECFVFKFWLPRRPLLVPRLPSETKMTTLELA